MSKVIDLGHKDWHVVLDDRVQRGAFVAEFDTEAEALAECDRLNAAAEAPAVYRVLQVTARD